MKRTSKILLLSQICSAQQKKSGENWTKSLLRCFPEAQQKMQKNTKHKLQTNPTHENREINRRNYVRSASPPPRTPSPPQVQPPCPVESPTLPGPWARSITASTVDCPATASRQQRSGTASPSGYAGAPPGWQDWDTGTAPGPCWGWGGGGGRGTWKTAPGGNRGQATALSEQ